MPITYLKQASKTPETESAAAQKVVADMLQRIESGGEAVVRDYARTLDQWTGDIVMTAAQIEAARPTCSTRTSCPSSIPVRPTPFSST